MWRGSFRDVMSSFEVKYLQGFPAAQKGGGEAEDDAG